MLPEIETVARDAFTNEIFFNILIDIEKMYKDKYGNNYQLKVGYELLYKSESSKKEILKLMEINEKNIVLHTKSHQFELVVDNTLELARLLVRYYNVLSCVDEIKNPDSRLWLSGLFFYWFLKSASSNNKSSALSASIHPLFGIIT